MLYDGEVQAKMNNDPELLDEEYLQNKDNGFQIKATSILWAILITWVLMTYVRFKIKNMRREAYIKGLEKEVEKLKGEVSDLKAKLKGNKKDAACQVKMAGWRLDRIQGSLYNPKVDR